MSWSGVGCSSSGTRSGWVRKADFAGIVEHGIPNKSPLMYIADNAFIGILTLLVNGAMTLMGLSDISMEFGLLRLCTSISSAAEDVLFTTSENDGPGLEASFLLRLRRRPTSTQISVILFTGIFLLGCSYAGLSVPSGLEYASAGEDPSQSSNRLYPNSCL